MIKEVRNMVSHIRIEGATPSGGVYSEIYFFDAAGNPVDETKAVRCIIRECAENGDLINETWGTVGNSRHTPASPPTAP